MIETNEHQLIELSVIGEISSPTLRQGYRVHPVSGQPFQLPSVGGIAYNAHLGDPAVGIVADHIEPGVSIRNTHESASRALNTFACIGNIAKVVSGDAKGALGHVIGKHGGVEHVMIHFADPSTLDRLVIGDRIQIRSKGTGLVLCGFPNITVMNMAPALLTKLFPSEATTSLSCAVTHQISAHLLGAGLGEETCQSGDVDIQLFDADAVKTCHLDSLRFGDLVAMMDCDHRYGRIYRKGWISVGVITHSCSIQAGHGPGVTTLLTAPQTDLSFHVSATANLKQYLPPL